VEVKESSAKYLARPSYQQTEIGPIPGDWTLSNLADLSAFITKGSTPTTYGFSWQQDGILFLRSECVSEDGLDLSQSKYISDVANASLRRSQICNGDLLITITGNVGRVILFKSSGNANINQHIARVRITAPEASRDFVYHFLTLPRCRKRFTSITTGQAYPQISLKQVREAPIPLPPTTAEQESIAEALNDADALVESLEQLLAKKRQLKQGAMQELLIGKMRLPGFSGEWEVKQLSDVCSMKSGELITSEDIDECSEFPCYGGNGLRGFTKTFTHDGRYALVGRQGALCGNVLTVDGQFFASEHAIVVTPKRETDIQWLSRVLARMNLNRYSESSAQPGLSVAKLLALESMVPPPSEQIAISATLADFGAEIIELEKKLAKTRDLKQGMMQELLTGRTRLVAHQAVERASC
jgi:type I restriction enzyme S subunit